MEFDAVNDTKKKLALNTVTSLSLQIITIICGFITPRLFLSAYGSEVNGLVQSVTQFLGVISFLELGIGQVIQSELYKHLYRCQVFAVYQDMCRRVQVALFLLKTPLDHTLPLTALNIPETLIHFFLYNILLSHIRQSRPNLA